MKVLVTGASGLLGRAVVTEFQQHSWNVLGLALTRARGDLVKIDLTNTDAVRNIVREFKPHAIVHCAGTRNPSEVNSPAKEQSLYPLNVTVSEELAKLASEIKAVFIFISSDNVFAGDDPDYDETETPVPRNAFGRLKLQAEKCIISAYPESWILRTSILYGGEENVSESAVSSLIPIILSSDRRRYLDATHRRCPSHVKDISRIIYKMVNRKLEYGSIKRNVFHWCGSEIFDEYGMAAIIASLFDHSFEHLIPWENPITNRHPINPHLKCVALGHIRVNPEHTEFRCGIIEFRRFFPWSTNVE